MDDAPDPMAQFFQDPDNVDLYQVLGLTSSASIDDIKKAYRRLALQHHPDKHQSANDADKAAHSLKFQQVGFAYTIVSDATRRARYDETGKTDESFLQGVADSEGGWEGYFEAIFDKVSRQRLDEDKAQYQGSEEEKADITTAYLESKGSIEHILLHVPHTTYHDEKRLTDTVNNLISDGALPSFSKWDKSLKDTKARATRRKQGAKEAAEAEEAAKELGVWDEFYGSGKPGERKKKANGSSKSRNSGDAEEESGDESALQALILKRAEKRKADSSSFLASLATKYGAVDETPKNNSGSKGKGKKRATPAEAEEDEQEKEDDVMASPRKKVRATKTAPPKFNDAEFAAVQARLFGPKTSSKAGAQTAASGDAKKAQKGKRSS